MKQKDLLKTHSTPNDSRLIDHNEIKIYLNLYVHLDKATQTQKKCIFMYKTTNFYLNEIQKTARDFYGHFYILFQFRYRCCANLNGNFFLSAKIKIFR